VKGTLLLADAIAGHPDQTFSLVRGGITVCFSEKEDDINFEGSILARVVAAPGDTGKHDFGLKFVDLDGKVIGKDVSGHFEVKDGSGIVQLVVRMKLKIPKFGKYTFTFSVDRRELDTWPLEAQPFPKVR